MVVHVGSTATTTVNVLSAKIDVAALVARVVKTKMPADESVPLNNPVLDKDTPVAT